MSVTALVLVVVVVLAVIAAVAWYFTQQRRHRELQERFGPEYERTVDTYGERGRAERELSARAERVASLDIRPLSADESASYGNRWREVQTRFVDDPERAIGEADRLCGEAMQARGYPMGDFEQRSADISVDHPHVVEHYRAAHRVAVAADRGDASTEELRQAMVHYRTLFQDLIETNETRERRVA